MHGFKDAPDGKHVYMDNAAIAGVMGKGKVLLKFTSRKSLCLNNVFMYLPFVET